MYDGCYHELPHAPEHLSVAAFRCVVDLKPRQLDTEQLALLCNFAEMAVREMEKDKLTGLQRGKSLAAEMKDHGMHRAVKALTSGLLVVDVRSMGWPVQFMNDQAADFVGESSALRSGCVYMSACVWCAIGLASAACKQPSS